jgi:hypothetical protein
MEQLWKIVVIITSDGRAAFLSPLTRNANTLVCACGFRDDCSGFAQAAGDFVAV